MPERRRLSVNIGRSLRLKVLPAKRGIRFTAMIDGLQPSTAGANSRRPSVPPRARTGAHCHQSNQATLGQQLAELEDWAKRSAEYALGRGTNGKGPERSSHARPRAI